MSLILDEKEKVEIIYNRLYLAIAIVINAAIFYDFPRRLYIHVLKSSWLWASFYLLFSLFGAYYIVKTLKNFFSKIAIASVEEEGLDIENMGIVDWSDIEKIEIKKRGFQHEIMQIFVNNPDDYIEQQTDINQRFMALNYKKYGTPFCILLYLVKYDKEYFLSTVEKYIAEAKNKNKINN